MGGWVARSRRASKSPQNKYGKGEVTMGHQGSPHSRRLTPVSMRQIGSISTLSRWDASPSQGYPLRFTGLTNQYTAEWRETCNVTCPKKEHDDRLIDQNSPH